MESYEVTLLVFGPRWIRSGVGSKGPLTKIAVRWVIGSWMWHDNGTGLSRSLYSRE